MRFHIHRHDKAVPGSYREGRGYYTVDKACRCGSVKEFYREIWDEEWR